MFLLLLLFAASARADAPAKQLFSDPGVDARSIEAERTLARIAGAEISSLKTKEEKEKWAGARLAWIALSRLQGRDEEAMKIFAGCEKLCRDFGSKAEWKAAVAWSCGRDAKRPECPKKK